MANPVSGPELLSRIEAIETCLDGIRAEMAVVFDQPMPPVSFWHILEPLAAILRHWPADRGLEPEQPHRYSIAPTIEELRKRFPIRYGRDHSERKNLGDLVKEFADVVDSGVEVNKIADFLDEHFFFGAWGNFWAGSDADLLLRDLRGIILSAYREGRKRGAKTDEENGTPPPETPNKPPIGCMPHNELRLANLCSAVLRYMEMGRTVPAEWLTEVTELCTCNVNRTIRND